MRTSVDWGLRTQPEDQWGLRIENTTGGPMRIVNTSGRPIRIVNTTWGPMRIENENATWGPIRIVNTTWEQIRTVNTTWWPTRIVNTIWSKSKTNEMYMNICSIRTYRKTSYHKNESKRQNQLKFKTYVINKGLIWICYNTTYLGPIENLFCKTGPMGNLFCNPGPIENLFCNPAGPIRNCHTTLITNNNFLNWGEEVIFEDYENINFDVNSI